ncbi:methyltransferase domain-containing protein [Azoarcus sp. KH32C]|uniref:methyltransferase domain-containing protein n=1 Tax=Azoarcus sp. KH32C TaxID=748247 RepID=UPI0002386C38|nr:methyltransferase domain-containing protein [Azoarcus sp. KH32C]BAL23329.1 biotin synthesis protein [Azoarcus sp. KH32C]
MAIDQDFALDRPLLKRRFERAAATYDEVAVLAREVGRRMDERLDYIRIQPKRILDLGCGTGADLEMLGKRFPAAQRVGADLAFPMLARARGERGLFDRLRAFGRTQRAEFACTDASALPFARASMSLVWSNLMLNWLADPLPALKEIHRVLEVDGMLMFSTFGPDTLRELRAALPTKGGERVHRFIDMHDLGDALVQAGFSDPVMDMEMVTMTYASVDELLHDLRQAGCANAGTARPRGLSGRAGWESARHTLEALRRDGRLPASFEIVQGHAWKAQPKTTEDGRSVIRFQSKPGGR